MKAILYSTSSSRTINLKKLRETEGSELMTDQDLLPPMALKCLVKPSTLLMNQLVKQS